MKKWIWGSAVLVVILVVGAFLLGRYVFPNQAPSDLPITEVGE